MEAVGLHVIGKARRAADTRDEDGILRPDAELGHGPLHGLENRIIAAPGAPAHLLVGGEILGGQFDDLVHLTSLFTGEGRCPDWVPAFAGKQLTATPPRSRPRSRRS